MSAAGVLAVVGILFPVVVGGLAKLQTILGPRVLRWIESRSGHNARAS